MWLSRSLLFTCAFTGCDVNSAFHGKGKKQTWQTWKSFGEVGRTFAKLSQYPVTTDDEDIQVIDRLISSCTAGVAAYVDKARFDPSGHKQRAYESIPPSLAAPTEHVKRVAYRAEHRPGIKSRA